MGRAKLWPRYIEKERKMTEIKTGEAPKRKRLQVDCSQGGRTVQSFKDELDVSRIVARYLTTGERPMPPGTAQWGATMPSEEFQERLESVAMVEQWFAGQTSKTRGQFDNDPAKALEWLEADKNRQEAEEMGLVATQAQEPNDQDLTEEAQTPEEN